MSVSNRRGPVVAFRSSGARQSVDPQATEALRVAGGQGREQASHTGDGNFVGPNGRLSVNDLNTMTTEQRFQLFGGMMPG